MPKPITATVLLVEQAKGLLLQTLPHEEKATGCVPDNIALKGIFSAEKEDGQ